MSNDINVVLGSGSSLFWASSRRFWSRSCFSSQVLGRQKISSSDFSSLFRKFPVGTSIVSRRSSRSYSHQSFYQVYFESLLDICSIFFFQYQSNSGNSARHLWLQHPTVFQIGPLLHSQVLHYWFNIIFMSDHFIAFMCCRHLRYYQPNVYHYHSTPWRYRSQAFSSFEQQGHLRFPQK